MEYPFFFLDILISIGQKELLTYGGMRYGKS